MTWLNYNHLYYFWTVVREGSIARAAKKLKRSQPTLSAQLRVLEEAVGERLFVRAGRGIQVTDHGRRVFEHATAIFNAGENLSRFIEGRPRIQDEQWVFGIVDALPKAISHGLLSMAPEAPRPARLVCREDRFERLLASLALNELDVVLAFQAAETTARQRLHSERLGRLDYSFFAAKGLRKLKENFPASLHRAPTLLPTGVSVLRSSLDAWYEARSLQPAIVGEFEDAALMELFAAEGRGLHAAPSLMAKKLVAMGLEPLGPVQGLQPGIFAITNERSRNSKALAAVRECARKVLKR